MADLIRRLAEMRRILLVVAAGLMLAAIALPIWQITLGAPQYPEGPLVVEMYLYPALSGDYQEVNALNAYVGFYYPDPVWMEPDFPIHEHSLQAPEWVVGPVVIALLALLNLFVAVAPSTRKLKMGLKSLFAGTAVVLATTVVWVQARLYQAGHSLDPNAPLVGVSEFTPPVLGGYQVANITGFASPGIGGYLAGFAVLCLGVGFLLRDNEMTIAQAPGSLIRWIGELISKGWNLLGLGSNTDTDASSRRGYAEVGFLAVAAAVALVLAGIPLAAGDTDDGQLQQFDFDIERHYEAPAVPDHSQVTIGDDEYADIDSALQAAQPGDTVQLEGQFDHRLVIDTPGITVAAAEGGAVIDGGGEGRVVTVAADDVVVEGLWVRNSGYEVGDEDAGVFVDGDDVELRGLYITEAAFGVWINGGEAVTVADSRIEGRRDVWPLVDRGNGIHLWQADQAVLENNEITAVRDGIYFSWSDHVTATDNAIWNTRYGVHYMYSSDNYLASNIAVDNDVGYALMVSDRLEIIGNIAVRNHGNSGHGILVKDIDDSKIRHNIVVENRNGLFVYNAHDNHIESNLVLRNRVGVHTTAGASGQVFAHNSFIDNEEPVVTTSRNVETWTGDDGGNYWSGARGIDLTNDGISEIRYRPAGLVEHLMVEIPQAAVFANSPAFDAVRLAESSFPVVEAPGVVDERPLVDPPHTDWRTYATGR